MTLEEIVSEIEENRKSSLSSINGELQAKEKLMEKKFQEELKSIEDEYRRKSGRDLKSFENREIDLANLESSRIIQARKYDLLKDGLARVSASFADFTSDSYYQEYLARGFEIAKGKLMAIGEIRCRKVDVAAMKKIAGNQVRISEGNMSGGFLATSSNGKIEVDFTLDSLFKDSIEEIEAFLSSKIGEK
jgi:vacuolar-type H+-ATPase subunit E/Vma4